MYIILFRLFETDWHACYVRGEGSKSHSYVSPIECAVSLVVILLKAAVSEHNIVILKRS